MNVGTFKTQRKPYGYQQITVSTSAVGLTVPAGATRAVLGIEAQPLRYRDDGTDPTTSVGFLVAAGGTMELDSKESLEAFKAIRSSGSDATLNVLYYGV